MFQSSDAPDQSLANSVCRQASTQVVSRRRRVAAVGINCT